MPSVAELRRKIRSIRSTRQITRAMQMVAGARLARAQREATEAEAFPREIARILSVIAEESRLSSNDSPLIRLETETPRTRGPVGVVVIAGDRGLCGDFNSAVMKAAERVLAEHASSEVELFLVGRKACDQMRKVSTAHRREYTDIYRTIGFGHASAIGQDILACFHERGLSQVIVVAQRLLSATRHQTQAETLLPVTVPPLARPRRLYLCEPDEADIGLLVSLLVKGRIYRALAMSYASELAARMTAMANATRNAGTLIDQFQLEANKARQASITRELIEIVGTGEVMKE